MLDKGRVYPNTLGRQPLVGGILVVVAETQMRTLKAEVDKGSCEQQLDTGWSILRDSEAPRAQA